MVKILWRAAIYVCVEKHESGFVRSETLPRWWERCTLAVL